MILPKKRDPRFITVRRGGTLQDADHHLLAMFATGSDRRGVTFAVAGLLLSITLLDVLLFYFEQFVAAAYVLGDFTLIGALEFYSNRYLFEAAEPVKVVQPHPEQTKNA